LKEVFVGEGQIGRGFLGIIGITASSTLNSLITAINFGVPLLSQTQFGPAWLSPDITATQLQILKLALDQISWLPRPLNFHEAISMANDEKIEALRADIRLWFDLLNAGKLQNLDDVGSSIRKRAETFRNKSWATRVTQVITYAAIPLTVADALIGSGYIGLSSALIGTAAQFVSDKLEKSRNHSWLSRVRHDPSRAIIESTGYIVSPRQQRQELNLANVPKSHRAHYGT